MIADETTQPAHVALLSADDVSDYTSFLQLDPRALLYYGLSYKSFLEDLLGCKASYWIARENGKITGILPLMRTSGPVGDVINSLPFFGSNGGVIATTLAAEAALVEKFENLSSASDVAASTWISHPAIGIRNPPVHDLVDERISQITQLYDDPRKLLSVLDSSARRNIKRAEGEGVMVRIDNDAFDFLEQAHNEGMATIGGNAKSQAFFQKVPHHFRPDVDYRIYVAEHQGEMCAALLLFYFGETIEYFTPVILESARKVQPMALILYQAMLDGGARGYSRWNWGGTWMSQDGVFRFKKKWGAQSGRYQYYIKLNRQEVRKCSRAELLQSYPGFYVIPFSELDIA